MDTRLIQEQTQRIEFNERAIHWLESYVLKCEPLSHTPQYTTEKWIAESSVNMPMTAASLPGNKEAHALLNTAMREFMPMIIQRALENAARGNAEARGIIRGEATKS